MFFKINILLNVTIISFVQYALFFFLALYTVSLCGGGKKKEGEVKPPRSKAQNSKSMTPSVTKTPVEDRTPAKEKDKKSAPITPVEKKSEKAKVEEEKEEEKKEEGKEEKEEKKSEKKEKEEKKKSEKKEEEKKEETKPKVRAKESNGRTGPEDSFDQLQPKKAEAKRTSEIKDQKVPNKGDYKTWQNFDTADFDKSIGEELKRSKSKQSDVLQPDKN